MTKEQFIAGYRACVLSKYQWAVDTTKLDKFMASVRTTLTTDQALWSFSSECTMKVWRELGGTGKATLKALRTLP